MNRKKNYNIIIECFIRFIEGLFGLCICLINFLSVFFHWILEAFSCFLGSDQKKATTSIKLFVNSFASELVHIYITDIEYQKQFAELFKQESFNMEDFANKTKICNNPESGESLARKANDDSMKKAIVIFLVHGLRGCNSHFVPVLDSLLKELLDKKVDLSLIKIFPINTENAEGILSVEESNNMLNNAIVNAKLDSKNCSGIIFMGHSMGGHRLDVFFDLDDNVKKVNHINLMICCIANPESQKLPEICNFIAKSHHSPLTFFKDFIKTFLTKERLKDVHRYFHELKPNDVKCNDSKKIYFRALYDWILGADLPNQKDNVIVVPSSHMSILSNQVFCTTVVKRIMDNVICPMKL